MWVPGIGPDQAVCVFGNGAVTPTFLDGSNKAFIGRRGDRYRGGSVEGW
jgi:hypothetical protein